MTLLWNLFRQSEYPTTKPLSQDPSERSKWANVYVFGRLTKYVWNYRNNLLKSWNTFSLTDTQSILNWWRRIRETLVHHSGRVWTADTQSSCSRQSKGSGAGVASTYSIVISSSAGILLVARCSPNLQSKISPLTRKENCTFLSAELDAFSET